MFLGQGVEKWVHGEVLPIGTRKTKRKEEKQKINAQRQENKKTLAQHLPEVVAVEGHDLRVHGKRGGAAPHHNGKVAALFLEEHVGAAPAAGGGDAHLQGKGNKAKKKKKIKRKEGDRTASKGVGVRETTGCSLEGGSNEEAYTKRKRRRWH